MIYLGDLPFQVTSPLFTDDEQALANELGERLMRSRGYLGEHGDYYDGTQAIRHLGIAIPEQLQTLRSVIGWPRLAVDAVDERLDIEGFRLPGDDTTDSNLWDIWQFNQMDQESQLAHVDALVYGRAFVIVGTGSTSGMPLITVETPLSMVADFDGVTKRVRAALQVYEFAGTEAVALYTENSTVHLTRDHHDESWQFHSRDDHNLGFAPVVMLTNRARSEDRYGVSEITPEVMSLNDAACRTVLGMEIAREFFGSPQRYVLGAAEGAFVNADGTPTNAWTAQIGRMLGLERDEEGNLPEVGQFPSIDPTPYTKILEDLSRRFAAITGLPPHLLGFATDNPASADAIRSSEERLIKRVIRKQRSFEGSWREVMRVALLVSGADLPDDSHLIDVEWANPRTPTLQSNAQSVQLLVNAGVLPPASKVAYELLGLSVAQREQLEQDVQTAQGQALLTQLTQGNPNDNTAGPGATPGTQGGVSGGSAPATPQH